MAQRVQYTIGINADTSAAKKSIESLDSSLKQIMAAGKTNIGLSKEFDEAAASAKILSEELSRAYNTTTGKLDISKFATGLKEAGTSISELATRFSSIGPIGEVAFQHLTNSIVQSEVPLKRINSTLQNMMTTLKNTVKWEISSSLVHGLESAFSGAVGYAKDLNTSLNNIRIVTGQSTDDMAKFAQAANKAAKELSTTTKSYSDAALIYYQQGDNDQLVAQKAALTIKAANASFGSSTKEMSEYLTAVWNSYQVGADQMEHYVDVMAALGAKTATSLEEIATSMQKVAATANTVGVSMEQVSSIIATVSSVTRESAESIGTSYKTIFARIGDLKLGKTDEDGIGLGTVSTQLKSIGVDILDANGELKDMGGIIETLMEKWQTMNAATKTAVAQAVAGKRQYTQLMALMENQDMYKENVDIATNSDGATDKMANIYAESWEAASKRAQVAMESIYSKIIDDKAIIGFTNGLATIIESIGDVIDGFGGIGGVALQMGAILTTVFQSKISGAISSAIDKFSNFKASFQDMKFSEGLKSFFTESTAKRDAKKLINQTHQEYSTQRSGIPQTNRTVKDDFTEGQIDRNQKLLEQKAQLLSMENSLSDAQKQRFQEALTSNAKTIEDLNTQFQAYENQKKEIQNIINSLKDQQAVIDRAKQKTGKDMTAAQAAQSEKDRIRDTMKEKPNHKAFNPMVGQKNVFSTDLGANTADLDKLLTRYSQLEAMATSSSDAVLALKNQISSMGPDTKITQTEINKFTTTLNAMKQILAENGADTSFIDNILQKIPQLKEGQKELKPEQVEAFKQALIGAQNTMNQLSSSTKTGAQSSFTYLSETLGVSSNELHNVASTSSTAAETLRVFAHSADQANQSIDNTGKSATKFSTKVGIVFGKIISGATSALSSFTTMSSAMANWDTSSLTSKITSVGNTVLNIGSQLATGNFVGAAMSAIGSVVGYFVGRAEAAKKKAEELDKIASETLDRTIENDKTTIQSSKDLITQFNELYAQKQQGLDVDKELSSVASELANKYNLTGEAVANLTGNYEEMIKKLREIASGNFSQTDAAESVRIAGTRISQNSALSSNNTATLKYDNTTEGGLAFNAQGDMLSNSQGGLVIPQQTQRVDKRQELTVSTYAFDSKTDKELTGVKGMSVSDIIADMGMDDYFIDDGGWAELLYNKNASLSYKRDIYARLSEMQKKMQDLGVSTTDSFYQGVATIIQTLEPEMTQYKNALENLTEEQIGKLGSTFIGRTPDKNAYSFETFTKDVLDVEKQLKGIFNNQGLTEDEVNQRANESLSAILGMNSGLEEYSSVLQLGAQMLGSYSLSASAIAEMTGKYGIDLKDINVSMFSSGNADYLQKRAKQNKTTRISSDAQIRYQESVDNQSLLKEEMSYEDMNKLHEAYSWGENGVIAWEDFYSKSYSDKKAYLESLSKQYLDVSKTAADNAVIAANETKTSIDNQVEGFLAEHQNVDEEAAKVKHQATVANDWLSSFVIDETGNEVLADGKKIGKDSLESVFEQQYLTWKETHKDGTRSAFLQDPESFGYKNTHAEGEVATYEGLLALQEQATTDLTTAQLDQSVWTAMANQIDSVTTSLTRLKDAINTIPSDKETFDKIAKLLYGDGEEGQKLLADSTAEDRAKQVVEYIKGLENVDIDDYKTTSTIYQKDGELVDVSGMTQEEIAAQGITSTTQTTVDYAGYAQEKAARQAALDEATSTLIQDEQQGLTRLSAQFDTLSNINISQNIDEGSLAWKAYTDSIKDAKDNTEDVIESVEEFNALSSSDKTQKIGEAKVKNLQKQQQLYKDMQTQMNNSGIDYATMEYPDAVAKGLEENWLAYQEYGDQVGALGSEIASVQAETAATVAELISQSWKAQTAQAEIEIEKLTNELEKMSGLGEELSSATAPDSVISTATAAKLAVAGLTQAWDEAKTAQERATVAAQAYNLEAQKQIEIQEKKNKGTNDLVASYDITKPLEGVNGAISHAFDQMKEDGGTDFSSYFIAEIEKIEDLSPEAKQAAEEIAKNLVVSPDATLGDYISAFEDAMNKAKDSGSEAVDKIVSDLFNSWSSVLESIYSAEQETANKVLEVWKKTFQAINDARTGALTGKTYGESLGYDAEQMGLLLKNQGVTSLSEAQAFLLGNPSGQTIQDQDLNTDKEMAIAGNGLAKYLTYDDGGRLTSEQSEDNLIKGMMGDLESLFSGVDGITALTDDAGKTIGYEKDGIEINEDNILQMLGTDFESVLTGAFGAIISQTGQIIQQNSDNITARIDTAQTNAQTAYDTGATGFSIGNQEGDQELIQKAMAAIAKDGDYSSLAEAEQARLEEIMGDNPITLDSLGQAAQTAATALLTLTSAASTASQTELDNIGTTEDGVHYRKNAVKNEKPEDPNAIQVTENGKTVGWVTQEDTITDSSYQDLVARNNTLHAATTEAESGNVTAATATVDAVRDALGMTEKELAEYIDGFEKASGRESDFANATDEVKEELAKFALTAAQAEDAWTDLTNSGQGYIKSLKDSKKGTKEYTKALSSLSKDIKGIFGNSLKDTDKFVEDNVDLIEDMANGVDGAAEDVEEAFLRVQAGQEGWDYDKEISIDIDSDGVADQLTTIGEMINTFGDEHANEPVGFKATMDNTPALAGLQELLSTGEMTAEEMESALAAIGWDPQIEWEKHTGSAREAQRAHGYIQGLDGMIPIGQELNNEQELTYFLPKIKGAKKTGGGASGAPSPSSSGGGGGGSKPQQKEKKRPTDDRERYHKINELMKRTAAELDKIDKLKERAYGKGHLAQMDAEISKLKEQIQEQQKLRGEVNSYLAADRARVTEYGAEFDSEGNIKNYDQVMDQLQSDYNAAVEQWNNGTMSEEAFKLAEERYQAGIDAIKQYEDTLAKAEEEEAAYLELQNKLSAAALEKITYTIEVNADLNEGDLAILEHYEDKYADSLEDQGKMMQMQIAQMGVHERSLGVLSSAMDELKKQHDAGVISDADFAKGMKQLREEALSEADALEDLKDKLKEGYSNALDLASEELSRFTDTLSNSADVMSQYITLLGLMGQSMNYEEIAKYYKVQNDANQRSVKIQKDYLDQLKARKAAMGDRDSLDEIGKANYDALTEAIRQANNDMLASTEATLQGLQDAYNNAIEGIYKDLDDALAGNASSLADLQDQYSQYQEEQERYVSTAKELYEVSKLNRSIEQSLQDATTSASKQMLTALQERIKLQSQSNDLSEYDIEMMNLQYKLALAKIALDEAQNSKDTVRMVRDDNGNLAYQYTADQDKVASAQQQYEDVLQEINDLSTNRISELEQAFLDAQTSFAEESKAIAQDMSLTQEQRAEKQAQLVEEYKDRLAYIQEQYGNATSNLSENQLAISEWYGEALVDSSGRTQSQLNTDLQAMIENIDEYVAAVQGAVGEGGSVSSAWGDYAAGVADLTKTLTGLSDEDLGTFEENIGKIMEAMSSTLAEYSDENEEASNGAVAALETISTSLDDVEKATAAWEAHAAQLAAVTEAYESMAIAAQAALTATADASQSADAPDVGGINQKTPSNVAIAANVLQDILKEAEKNGTVDSATIAAAMEQYNAVLAGGADGIVEKYASIADSNTAAAMSGGGKAKSGESDEATQQMYQEIVKATIEQINAKDSKEAEFTDTLTARDLADISKTFQDEITSYMVGLGAIMPTGATGEISKMQIDQNVTITAEFPNAFNKDDIEDAFSDLINLSAQYASKTMQ